jgi:predicted AAA+ superfamily ATPase
LERSFFKRLILQCDFGIDTGTIITTNEKRTEQIEKYRLNIVPVWEWLLS